MQVKPKQVYSHDELPERYILFPDNLDAAVKRMEKIEEKFLKRGIRVPHPYSVFRITVKENVYKRGKKTVKVERKPFSQLAFRVEKT